MSTPFRERNPVVIGAISLAVLAGLLLASFKAASLPIIGGGDVYYAAFSEAGGLEADDEVRIAGVRVGKVEDIELAGDHVRVRFRIEDDAEFGQESAAAIKVKTLLGSMFLAIEPAGDGQMNEGDEIPVERTTSPYDVVEAFSGLAETSAEIDTDQLAESLTTFADLTRNTPEEFRAALDGVSALSSNVAAKNEQINTLLQNLEKVSHVLDERDEDIIALMRDADVLFRALVKRREAIHRLLVSTSRLSVELTTLVRQSREDLAPALANLESVVQVLNKNEDNIDNSLRLMAPFYRVFANTLGTGPWFDTYIQNLPPVPDAPNLGLGAEDVLNRLVIPAVVVALLVVAGFTFLGGEERKTITAHFPRTVSLYEGSDVRVLGVAVGTVDSVTPSGTDVVVKISYEESVKVPSDAKAVIISPSVVGDRYVQLTPAYTGGEVLGDGATMDVDQTAVPLELDQIYDNLDKLNVALGPNGANREGALSDLLQVTADNFGGQGEQFHQTISDFADFSQTLSDNRTEFFDSTRALQGFISTLAENDQTVRRFNDSMADVSTVLEGEKEELAAALRNLSVALGEVSTFVRDNRDALGRNIRGLNRVAGVLAKQRDALDEILTAAPLALNNLALTYNPQAGTLDTRSNIGETVNLLESDPSAFLCSILDQADDSGTSCDALEAALPNEGDGPSRVPFGQGPNPAWQERYDPSLGGLVEEGR